LLKNSQEKAIERAHRDAIIMAEMAKDINFADPAAIDFFGPAYINKDYHDAINALRIYLAILQHLNSVTLY